MARSEAVEEVDEGKSCAQSRNVGGKCQVVSFLNRCAGDHADACLTACHNVGVVAEDRKSVAGYCSCRNVENARKKFARNFVEVRDHEKKTLGSGVCRGERTAAEGSVDCAASAAFGLKFGNDKVVSENVLFAVCAPFVGNFSHRRTRSDGIDRCNFRHRETCVSDRRVSVNTFHNFFCHKILRI